jgi:threonylcarbamoyladenosine tRNA methylthiotransferase MtaB
MKRPYQREFFRDLVLNINDKLPHAAIGLDCLIGFPGETDQAFHSTYKLVESLPVSYLHVFPFSPREGTPAWNYADKVEVGKVRERCRVMRSLGNEKKKRYYEKFVGKQLSVLVEQNREPSTGMLKGMSSNYIPVLIDGADKLKNSIQTVTITRVSENLMVYGKLK